MSNNNNQQGTSSKVKHRNNEDDKKTTVWVINLENTYRKDLAKNKTGNQFN